MPCFVPAFSGKASKFLPLHLMLTEGFLQILFIKLRREFSESFCHEYMLDFVKYFFFYTID